MLPTSETTPDHQAARQQQPYITDLDVDLGVSHPELPRSGTEIWTWVWIAPAASRLPAVACWNAAGQGWGRFCDDAGYNTPGGLSEQAQAGPSAGAGPALPRRRPPETRLAGGSVRRGPCDLHVHSNSAQDLRQPPPTARKYTPHRH